jgi:hypothetical protein
MVPKCRDMPHTPTSQYCPTVGNVDSFPRFSLDRHRGEACLMQKFRVWGKSRHIPHHALSKFKLLILQQRNLHSHFHTCPWAPLALRYIDSLPIKSRGSRAEPLHEFRLIGW